MGDKAGKGRELTDEDFRSTIVRAIRLTAIVVAAGTPLVWWKLGWRSAVFLLVGGVISGSGLYEWLRLMTAVMHRMDVHPETEGATVVRPLVPVLLGFGARMCLALVLLYVSLKTLDGSVYVLAAGLALGVFALTFEAIKMMRLWTV